MGDDAHGIWRYALFFIISAQPLCTSHQHSHIHILNTHTHTPGRAAQRLNEATHLDARTIHRLLGSPSNAVAAASISHNSDEDDDNLVDDMQFLYNERRRLPGYRFLVDEASMLDAQVAGALFQALPLEDPRMQLVLVGDVDQLPPVGPGSVLQHIIASRTVCGDCVSVVSVSGVCEWCVSSVSGVCVV